MWVEWAQWADNGYGGQIWSVDKGSRQGSVLKVGILNQLAGPPQKLEHNRQNKNDIKIMLSNIFFAVWTISNNILF